MTIHIIGAGLAGLSAAVNLAKGSKDIILYEATGQAGGRCRSFDDLILGQEIDNGNHLILGANHEIFNYLNILKVEIDHVFHRLPLEFNMIDLSKESTYTIKPTVGRIPWWIFSKSRRFLKSTAVDYLEIIKIFIARSSRTVSQSLAANNILYEKLWRPLTLAIMNAKPEDASAKVFGKTLRKIFFEKGGIQPFISKIGLSKIFVEPALDYLEKFQVQKFFNCPLKAIDFTDKTPKLVFAAKTVVINADDKVIFAVPPYSINKLNLPIAHPQEYESILNVHFSVLPDIWGKFLPQLPSMIGLIHGISDWIFLRPNLISITKSAANDIDEKIKVDHIWQEVKRSIKIYYGIEQLSYIKSRVIMEKRATFLQNPHNCRFNRPSYITSIPNFYLAGDWTDTNLPATIEGAISSGKNVAAFLL